MKNNLILIFALASSLVSSGILVAQFFNTHSDHGSSAVVSQHAEAGTLPLDIDFYSKIKEKAGDAEISSDSVQIEEEYIDAENHCEMCTYIAYTPGPRKQAGIAYSADKVLDLSGAKSVTFFVMGLEGDEVLSFKVAGKKIAGSTITDDKESKDKSSAKGSSPELFMKQKFAITTEEVILEKDWKKFTIDLTGLGKDALTDITHPFAIEMISKNGEKRQEFYIKYITYDVKEAKDFPTATQISATTQDNATISALDSTVVNASTTDIASEPLSAQISANSTNGTATVNDTLDEEE